MNSVGKVYIGKDEKKGGKEGWGGGGGGNKELLGIQAN